MRYDLLISVCRTWWSSKQSPVWSGLTTTTVWSQGEPDSFTTDSKHSHLQHQAWANQSKPKLETRKQQHGPLPPSLNAIHNSANTGLCQMWLLGTSHNSVTPKNRAASTHQLWCQVHCRLQRVYFTAGNYKLFSPTHIFMLYIQHKARSSEGKRVVFSLFT